jgi:hypothetical protein
MDTVFFVGVCLAKAFGKYAEAHWVAKAVESPENRDCRFGVNVPDKLGFSTCAVETASRFC